jgi:ABC-type nitrate/sulfonate/bicarbonate transport system substrate-binding protein
MKRPEFPFHAAWAALVTCAVILLATPPFVFSQGTKLVKVTVGLPVPPTPGNMWLEVGKAQGWDRELGIDLSLERATGGGAVTALVVGGGADIGLGLPDAFMNTIAQGQDLVAFWKLHPPHVGVFQVLARKDAGISGWKDLKGKRIGILGPASATKYSTDLMLFANDVDPRNVEYVNLGGVGAYMEALKAKRVDAVGSWLDPTETVFKPSPLWPDLTVLPADLYQGDLYLAKREFVTKHRDQVVAFCAVLMKSMAFYLDHPDQAVDIAKARIPELAAVDREKAIQAIVVSRPTRGRTGLFDLDEIRKYVPLGVKAGLIKGLDPATFDPAKYFLNDYARAAAERLPGASGR